MKPGLALQFCCVWILRPVSGADLVSVLVSLFWGCLVMLDMCCSLRRGLQCLLHRSRDDVELVPNMLMGPWVVYLRADS